MYFSNQSTFIGIFIPWKRSVESERAFTIILLQYKMKKYTNEDFSHWLQQWVIQMLLEIRVSCLYLSEKVFNIFLKYWLGINIHKNKIYANWFDNCGEKIIIPSSPSSIFQIKFLMLECWRYWTFSRNNAIRLFPIRHDIRIYLAKAVGLVYDGDQHISAILLLNLLRNVHQRRTEENSWNDERKNKKTANTSMLEKVFILLSAFSFDLQGQAWMESWFAYWAKIPKHLAKRG